MSIDPKKFLARATTGSAMSRIRKRKRALKRARAQVTVESAKVTGETIICAGMPPEREAEVRKQYYRDHEPTPAIVNADLTPEYLDKLKLDCLRAAHNSMPGADPHAVVRAAAADLEARLGFLRGQDTTTSATTALERERAECYRWDLHSPAVLSSACFHVRPRIPTLRRQ